MSGLFFGVGKCSSASFGLSLSAIGISFLSDLLVSTVSFKLA